MASYDPYLAAASDHMAFVTPETGEVVTFGVMRDRVARIAGLLQDRGITAGDVIVILAGNDPTFLQICIAARTIGVHYTPASKFLTRDEIGYILENSGAKAIFASAALAPIVADLAPPNLSHRFTIDASLAGFELLDNALASIAGVDVSPRNGLGRELLYSSGTTGRPKGIRALDSGDGAAPAVVALTNTAHFHHQSVNLVPAPLYHAAPLRFATSVVLEGATNVIMERFDAVRMLEAIERYRVTHLQVVPTMLIRLLKLPEEVRRRFDISSLEFLSHSAGPCPIEVKRKIIDWFGPIVVEHYGGTEGNGLCSINSAEWLAHPGSVGRAVIGRLHIVGEDGTELPNGEIGTVFFEGGPKFEYRGDAEKTASAYNDRGWSTLGDLGRVDDEGYLYLVERRNDLILSGGVNIYPREIETALLAHPDVQDAGVIGEPDEEFGQRIVAFIQPRSATPDESALIARLDAHCRADLGSLKTPRRYVMLTNFPRDETGKLFKDRLRQLI